MQADLEADYPNLPIQIIGINGVGYSSGIASFTSIHSLPMVEDTNVDQIWTQWDAVWRDVMILDGNNELVHTYNLTTYSLNDTVNYDTLKQLFVDTANGL